jgi:hypothetical protein
LNVNNWYFVIASVVVFKLNCVFNVILEFNNYFRINF